MFYQSPESVPRITIDQIPSVLLLLYKPLMSADQSLPIFTHATLKDAIDLVCAWWLLGLTGLVCGTKK